MARTKRKLEETEVPALVKKKASLQEPETKLIVAEAAQMIAAGKRRLDVMNELAEKHKFNPAHAERYYYSALEFLKPKDMDAFREEMIAKNFARLEELYSMAVERNDIKGAVDVMKVLNTMLGIASNRVQLGQQTPDGTTQVIELSFD